MIAHFRLRVIPVKPAFSHPEVRLKLTFHPIRHEPEIRVSFQCGMSLNLEWSAAGNILLLVWVRARKDARCFGFEEGEAAPIPFSGSSHCKLSLQAHAALETNSPWAHPALDSSKTGALEGIPVSWLQVMSPIRSPKAFTSVSYTRVSGECGIPALLLFLLSLGASLVAVHGAYRQARRPGFKEIQNASFCYVTPLIGIVVAITFLANAYRFYLPAMVGLAIALGSVAKRHMEANGLVAVR
jgi:hypothetical protein